MRTRESELSSLLKSGEGSRGGKVIGHTKSGKPIYESFAHEGHKNFDPEDHDDAVKLHRKLFENRSLSESQIEHHAKQSRSHGDESERVRAEQTKEFLKKHPVKHEVHSTKDFDDTPGGERARDDMHYKRKYRRW